MQQGNLQSNFVIKTMSRQMRLEHDQAGRQRLNTSKIKSPREIGTCHFLALPWELRHHIYKFALTDPEAILIQYPREDANALRTPRSPWIHQPALCAVNRQIRHEALLIFYGQNAFHSWTVDMVAAWLRDLDVDHLRVLRCVHFFTNYDLCFSDDERLAMFAKRLEGLGHVFAKGLRKSSVLIPSTRKESRLKSEWLSADQL
ncbi:hypothetical protein LTR56_019631 [Elasticomyces elasticus]|nr:hypothetical protein LTR56_019631 [Elasticomyces elasticus]KAK3662322.1 hypothetical protein LTR22_006855 [Elasticomyces elasticus]KAK4924739.1 hypothetical protein LTR49_008188 [Elasticomyces elasticus]KAK5766855.1 hypothetical protein LTS12_002931 [Elasticomyces elasticus]